MSGFSVYTHANRETGKVYVGITSMKPERRWLNGNGYRENKKFFSDIEKYGWDAFDHKIIATDLTEEQAVSIEKALISGYEATNRGYNKSEGGKYASKRALNHTANQIKDGMKHLLSAHPYLADTIEIFDSAEAAGSDSLLCQNLNIHCVEIVKLIERRGNQARFDDPTWVAEFVFWLRRNTLACDYYDLFGELKGFDEAYPNFDDYMRAVYSFNGKQEKIDAAIRGLVEKIKASKIQKGETSDYFSKAFSYSANVESAKRPV